MAELATLARPYANAVFELAAEQDKLDQWSDMLALLSTIAQDAQILALVSSPKISKEQLVEVVLEVSGDHLDDQCQNLVRVLVDNRRLAVLPSMARQYEKLKAEKQNYIAVELVSTYAVKPAHKTKVEEALQKRFGRDVRVEVSVDRALMGGWIIRAGDQILDLSVRGRLQNLAAELH